jgi:hypothetical protein
MVQYAAKARSHSVDVICDFGWQRFRWELSGLFGTDLKDKAPPSGFVPETLSRTRLYHSAALRVEQKHHSFHFEAALSQ